MIAGDTGVSGRPSGSTMPDKYPLQRIGSTGRALSLMALLYACAVAGTHTMNVADAPIYAREISDWAGGIRNGQMWEFGHVLWRPLAYSVAHAAWPGLNLAPEAERLLFVRRVLDDISLFCGGITVLLFWLLAREASGSGRVAYGVSIGFLCFEAFLSFSPAGTSYIPGLMFSTLGLWLMLRAASGAGKWAWMSGMASGAAALLWVPYVLSIPASLLMGWYWIPRERRNAFLMRAILGAALIGLAGYGVGAAGRGVHTPDQFHAWMQNGVHAKQTKNLIREGIGFPRAFLPMGADGILYKRYLLHDIYTPVRIVDLLRASLWKIGLFYVFLATLTFCLWGNRMLFVLAAAAIPHLALAFLYEAGSPERYLPIFPFLLVAIATVPTIRRAPRGANWVIVAFLILSTITNLWASAIESRRLQTRETAKVRSMRGLFPPESIAWVLDKDLLEYLICWPFDPENKPAPVPVRQLYIPMDVGLPWKQNFVRKTLAEWSQGGTVWVSKGLFADRPAPQYYWTERDQPDEVWSDFRLFFSQFEYAVADGQTDGFARLEDSARNRRLMQDIANR